MACLSSIIATPTLSLANHQVEVVTKPNFYKTKIVTKHPITSSSSSSSISTSISPRLRLCSQGFSSSRSRGRGRGRVVVRAGDAAMTTEKLGITIVNNPPESKLSDLGVRSWPKWGCPPSKFPWTYSDKETCYLLKGKVKVYPEGSDEGVEFGAGDLVVFPKGMSCTWDVSETVDKHYKFE